MNRTSILAILALVAACGGHAQDHAASAERAESFTAWTDRHEIFVDYPAFVVGQKSVLAAHVTQLDKQAPVATGGVVATLRIGGTVVEGRTAAPARPGIYRPELTPTTAGPCTLTLRIEYAGDEATVACTVRAAGAPPPPAAEEPPGRITFPKEIAWSTDFAITLAGERELVPTLRTTGELRATAGREARLTATTRGRVVIDGPTPVLGADVAAGQVIARIVPQVDNAGDRVSLVSEVRQARAELDAAESQLARSERLWAERTIPEKQLDEARTRVAVQRARHDAAQGKLGQFDAGASGGAATAGRTTFQVRSPIAGKLVAIHVSSGHAVDSGELLFTVVDLARVWLHADVFEPDLARVEQSTRASFRVDGYDRPISIAPPDGRVVTIGQLVDEKTRTVPIVFELANPENRLRIGSFATVWIETGPPVRALAIPETALVDDAGRKVAYVQVEGESFERRLVAPGIRSGGWVEVKAGIAKGDRVVTRGAYEIKLAAAGGAVPEHNHAH